MTYTPPASLNDLLESWEATYSLTGGFSASAKFKNPSKVLNSQSLLWAPLQISTAATVTSYEGVTDTQYAGTVSWVSGIVSSVQDSEDISETGDESLSVNLTSYFERLKDRPVNTEYYDTTLGTVLASVLTLYGGIPAGLYGITAGHAANFKGVVQGESIYTELEMLARAVWADLYVQVGGQLEVGTWKDANSSVDYTLGDEAVLNIEWQRSIEKAPTAITVRGGYQSMAGCGLRVLSGEPNAIPSEIGRQRCMVPGAESMSVDVALKNLEGGHDGLKNSGLLLDGDTEFQKVNVPKEKESNEVTMTVTPNPTYGTQFTSGAVTQTVTMVVGRPDDEKITTGNSSRGKGGVERQRKQDKFNSRITGTPPGTVTGPPTLSVDETSDSSDKGRLNFSLLDATLASDYGIVQGSVDNPYIVNALVAFRVAIREFQETRMRRRTLKLSTVYIPALRLNHVITFKDKAGNSITGRIVELKVGHDIATAKTDMTLTVECFTDLGSLSYVSDNLLVYPELCGINGIDWKIVSGTIWAVGSGFFAFDGASKARQSLVLITGLTYTCTFTVTNLAAGSFIAKVGAIGTTPTITAGGTYSFNFVPITENNDLDFESLSGDWLLSKPSVVVTATGF